MQKRPAGRSGSALLGLLLVLVLALARPEPAAALSAVDGFDPNANGTIRAAALQHDGKILVGGEFTTIGGTSRPYLARLNPDGTVDGSFSAKLNGSAYALAVQPDGRILVGGDFTSANDTPRNHLVRLEADGTLDGSFAPDLSSKVLGLALQPDGNIVVGGSFDTVNGVSRSRIVRLDPDGGVDVAFDPGSGANADILVVVAQPDGKLLVGGAFTQLNGAAFGRIARLHADGSPDLSFNPDADGDIRALSLLPDGRVVVGGAFSAIGGQPLAHLARLEADGSVDGEFDAGVEGTVQALALQPDGGLVVGGSFVTVAESGRPYLARLGVDGALDFGFTPMADAPVHVALVQHEGHLLVAGEFTAVDGTTRNRIARLAPDGRVDKTLELVPSATLQAVAVQPDGKVLLGGEFTTLGGVSRNYIARLNSDGTLDDAFDPQASNRVRAVAVQPDEKVIVVGDFTSLKGVARNRIARLHPDGSVDLGFNPNANNNVYALTLQPDGKVLIGGAFSSVAGVTRNSLARLNPDGTLDTGFNPSTNGWVYALAVQPDGKVVVGGFFTSVSGQARSNIARLNPDGTLDAGFIPSADSKVGSALLQPDGKILIAGNFTTVTGVTRNRIARLNEDGTLDNFDPNSNGDVYALSAQANGRVLVGGYFGQLGGEIINGIGRVNADGSLDATFKPGGVTMPILHGLSLQADGKPVATGYFSTLGGESRTNLARLSVTDAASQSLSVAVDGSAVAWALGGGFPLPYQVLFDASADGLAWSPLGWGRAVAGTSGVRYELEGLALPLQTHHYVRATAWVNSGGIYGSSVSLSRSVVRYFANGPVATPTFEPAPGLHTGAQSVIITSATPEAAIDYSLDGGDTWHAYTAPVSVETSLTLLARGRKVQWADSAVVSGAYTINQPPVVADPTYHVEPEQPVTTDLLALASDPDGDPLEVDGFTQGTHGSVTAVGEASVTYTPAAGFSGTDTFTYTVADGRGGSTTGTVTVVVSADWDGDGLPNLWELEHGLDPFDATGANGAEGDPDGDGLSNLEEFQAGSPPNNRLPVAAPDAYGVAANGTTSFPAGRGLLANDSDADDDALTAHLVSGPSYGILSLASDGSFSYTHDGSAGGSDGFTYRAFDGKEFSPETTVTLTVRSRSAPDADLVIDRGVVRFTAVPAGSTANAYAALVNVGSEPREVSGITVTGPHAEQFAVAPPPFYHPMFCNIDPVQPGAYCIINLSFTPDGSGLRFANLQVSSDDLHTPLLSALLTNTETEGDKARRRLAPVLAGLRLFPEGQPDQPVGALAAGERYTVEWELLGYHQQYHSLVALFDCRGITDGSCADSYGDPERFATSGNLTPVLTEVGEWVYNGVTSGRFTYRYTFTLPAERFAGEGGDVVLRFYSKSDLDQIAGSGSISLLVPGNLPFRYYDSAGRRLVVEVSP